MLALLLCGCGADAIRKEAQTQIDSGNYESALKTYQDGLTRYPGDVVLRSGMLGAQETIFDRLMTDAASARTAGNTKQANDILTRALAINPDNDRAKAMALDIARDLRLQLALSNARELVRKGMQERAALVIEAGLKDDPKNANLLALQQQIELEAKQTELGTVQLKETRPVSLDFRDANLRMILDALKRNTGVNFVLDKDVQQDLRATIYIHDTRLDDALNLLTTTNQLAYKVVDPVSVLIYPNTPDKKKTYQDLLIRTFYLSNADVKQTAALLKAMLKVRDPFVDEKRNMIMLREPPETIRLAERLIALQDVAEPEVMMELQVLEVQRNSLTNIGVSFPDTFTMTPTAPTGSTGFTLGNLKSINKDSIGVTTPSVTINLHKDVGEVNLLANPRIRARNREAAKIMIGDKLPVVTTTGNATNNGYISESVQYVDVGLKLTVQPDIYLDDEVGIKIGLEVSSLVNQITTAGGSLVYEIGTRTADTTLQLHDGETQVLAGLINKEERMSANRVPGIGDMPVIGRLFSSQNDDGKRTEIVLSITPHIIRNIRRPDLNQTEFWSGTENDVRIRPLNAGVTAKAPAGSEQAAGNAAPVGKAPALPAAAAQANGSETAVAPDVSITLKAPSEVKVGDMFEVQVALKSTAPIRGVPVQLDFSKQTLEVLGVDEGPFLKQDGMATSSTKALAQKDGRASMAILRNTAVGASGAGALMTFHFKALAAGIAEVHLASAKVIAAGNASESPLPAATTITVK